MILETPIDRPEGEDIKEEGDGSSKGKKKKPAGASAKLVPDYNVWAGEIALLESLIGMDPEGEEFRALEAKLSEEGREMREKQMEQYERKMKAEAKKAAKKEKGQKTLMEMMNGGGKGKGNTKTKSKTTRGKKGKDESDGEGSDEEGCQSCSEK